MMPVVYGTRAKAQDLCMLKQILVNVLAKTGEQDPNLCANGTTANRRYNFHNENYLCLKSSMEYKRWVTWFSHAPSDIYDKVKTIALYEYNGNNPGSSIHSNCRQGKEYNIRTKRL